MIVISVCIISMCLSGHEYFVQALQAVYKCFARVLASAVVPPLHLWLAGVHDLLQMVLLLRGPSHCG